MADYKYSLKITGPEGFELDFDVPVGITRLGRQAGNDIVLAHSLVSRGHARLETTASECHITDLGSSNGTKVNNEKIAPNAPVQLKKGDIITIGGFELIVHSIVVPVHETKEIKPPAIDPSVVSSVEPAPEPPPKPAKKAAAQPKKPEAEKAKIPEAAKSTSQKKPAPKKTAVRKAASPPPPPPPPAAETGFPSRHPSGLPGQTIYSSKLLDYLPGIYHTDFMSRFLGIFEATSLPIEWIIDNFDLFLSPNTAPADFLPWLASWFGITFDETWSEDQRRILLDEAHKLYAMRGTAWALSRVLEIYTGQEPSIDDKSSSLDPFTFNVDMPLRKREVNTGLIEALIEAHKPAHTNYTLTFKR